MADQSRQRDPTSRQAGAGGHDERREHSAPRSDPIDPPTANRSRRSEPRDADVDESFDATESDPAETDTAETDTAEERPAIGGGDAPPTSPARRRLSILIAFLFLGGILIFLIWFIAANTERSEGGGMLGSDQVPVPSLALALPFA